MAKLTDSRKQHLRVSDATQLELNSPVMSADVTSADYESKLAATQQQLEQLQQQQEMVRRQKEELEQLTQRKTDLIEDQISLSERLTGALTAIDRQLFDMRQEMEDLEQTRKCFAEHQQRIDVINPEAWSREELKHELDRAVSVVDHAEDEYEEALTYFENTSHASIFGNRTKKRTKAVKSASSSEFASMFKQGLAFNLPIFALGLIWLIVYLSK